MNSAGRMMLQRRGAVVANAHHHQRLVSGSSPKDVRQMSSYVLDGLLGRSGGGGGGGGSSMQWPISKPNMFFNIVPQGHRYVVERFGKLASIEDSGWFLGIPFVDKIAYIVDIRERAMDIPPQSAITRDNVSVEVSGNLFVRFNDAEKAAYGAFNPLYSVTQHSQSAMRSAIGEMELDEILHGRAQLNSLIKGSLQEAAIPWGLEIRRYEITEITPDNQIRIAMDKQAAAERDRREQVLRAEGDKRRAELISEGNLIKVRNEADGEKTKIVMEAQGHAEAVKLAAQAQAEALNLISAELNRTGGSEAAKLNLAQDYSKMYGEIGSNSNTIFFNERPGDVNALLTQAVTAMQTATNSNTPPAKTYEFDPISTPDSSKGGNNQ